MEHLPNEDVSSREGSEHEAPPQGESGRGPPPDRKPAAPLFGERPGKPMPEPRPVPRWMIVAGECVLFGVPVLLVILPFGPRLPGFGLADPLVALVDLAALLAVIFGAGAAIRTFVLSPLSGKAGAALRRFGARAKRWYAADRNRGVWTYLALVALWMLAFQLPRLSGLGALVFAGTLVFCLAAAFAIFTAGLVVVAGAAGAAGNEHAPAAGATSGEPEEEAE